MTHTLTTIDGKMHLQAVNPFKRTVYDSDGAVNHVDSMYASIAFDDFQKFNPPILWIGPELSEGTILKDEEVEIKTEIGIGSNWIDNSNGFYSDYYINRHSYLTRQVATLKEPTKEERI